MVTKEQAEKIAKNIMVHLNHPSMADAPYAERQEVVADVIYQSLFDAKEHDMKKGMKGAKVSWLAEGATVRGHGVIISDEENGRVLVAVDGGVLENIPAAYHMVIYCTVTWLTVEP